MVKRHKEQINPRFLKGGDIYEASEGKGPEDPLFPDDPSTRQYIQLHDHEYLTVEKVLIAGKYWFYIKHIGQLTENEFRHQMLIDGDEAAKFMLAMFTAEVNPVPEGA